MEKENHIIIIIIKTIHKHCNHDKNKWKQASKNEKIDRKKIENYINIINLLRVEYMWRAGCDGFFSFCDKNSFTLTHQSV